MEIFSASLLLAIFPYIFMGSFPIVGLVLVTKWVLEDFRRSKRKVAVDTKNEFQSGCIANSNKSRVQSVQ